MQCQLGENSASKATEEGEKSLISYKDPREKEKAKKGAAAADGLSRLLLRGSRPGRGCRRRERK